MATTQTIDEAKLNAFLGQVVGDLSGYAGTIMAYIGDRLGLYAAMAEAGSVTSTVLGFTKFRRATETPFNRIFEARK